MCNYCELKKINKINVGGSDAHQMHTDVKKISEIRNNSAIFSAYKSEIVGCTESAYLMLVFIYTGNCIYCVQC